MRTVDYDCTEIELIATAIKEAGREIGKEGAGGMGALEGLGVCVRDGFAELAEAVNNLARAVEAGQ